MTHSFINFYSYIRYLKTHLKYQHYFFDHLSGFYIKDIPKSGSQTIRKCISDCCKLTDIWEEIDAEYRSHTLKILYSVKHKQVFLRHPHLRLFSSFCDKFYSINFSRGPSYQNFNQNLTGINSQEIAGVSFYQVAQHILDFKFNDPHFLPQTSVLDRKLMKVSFHKVGGVSWNTFCTDHGQSRSKYLGGKSIRPEGFLGFVTEQREVTADNTVRVYQPHEWINLSGQDLIVFLNKIKDSKFFLMLPQDLLNKINAYYKNDLVIYSCFAQNVDNPDQET